MKMNSTDETVRDNCNWDKQRAVAYFGGATNLLVYYNYGEFQHDEFGTESIMRTSGLHASFVDTLEPSWIEALIEKQELVDETDYL